jgi:hypothetical protein
VLSAILYSEDEILDSESMLSIDVSLESEFEASMLAILVSQVDESDIMEVSFVSCSVFFEANSETEVSDVRSSI